MIGIILGTIVETITNIYDVISDIAMLIVELPYLAMSKIYTVSVDAIDLIIHKIQLYITIGDWKKVNEIIMNEKFNFLLREKVYNWEYKKIFLINELYLNGMRWNQYGELDALKNYIQAQDALDLHMKNHYLPKLKSFYELKISFIAKHNLSLNGYFEYIKECDSAIKENPKDPILPDPKQNDQSVAKFIFFGTLSVISGLGVYLLDSYHFLNDNSISNELVSTVNSVNSVKSNLPEFNPNLIPRDSIFTKFLTKR